MVHACRYWALRCFERGMSELGLREIMGNSSGQYPGPTGLTHTFLWELKKVPQIPGHSVPHLEHMLKQGELSGTWTGLEVTGWLACPRKEGGTFRVWIVLNTLPGTAMLGRHRSLHWLSNFSSPLNSALGQPPCLPLSVRTRQPSLVSCFHLLA